MARLPLSLLGTVSILFPLSHAAGDWVGLSLTGPDGISDNTISFYYYANNILIGTPPATESLVLDLISPMLAVSSDDCVFCPGAELFDPALSSTYHMTRDSWSNNATDFGGVLAQETVSFGGVLTSQNTPFSLIERMSQNFTERILDGHLGLFVDPTNQTSRDQHILSLLHKSGQLPNPMVGLRLGDNANTSRITIGAIDPNDYEGTINWIQAETPDSSWDSPVAIQIDGFRGYNGSFLPYPNPMLAYLDTLNIHVQVPNAWTYMSTDNYTGPVETINIDPDLGTYGFICNQTGGAYVPLSVDINGVNYQIDSQNNLLRNQSGESAAGFCNVGIRNLTTTASVPSLLGLPFLRSVYFAYRFPTDDCPNAYYGFAFPKDSNRTSSMIAQTPRSTPSASAQCLSMASPISTPTIATPPPQPSVSQLLSDGSYNVFNSPDTPQVRLKGVDELKAGLIRGPTDDS